MFSLVAAAACILRGRLFRCAEQVLCKAEHQPAAVGKHCSPPKPISDVLRSAVQTWRPGKELATSQSSHLARCNVRKMSECDRK